MPYSPYLVSFLDSVRVLELVSVSSSDCLKLANEEAERIDQNAAACFLNAETR